MKARLVVILAIAMLAGSERSFPRTHQPSDMKSAAPADSAASAIRPVTVAAQGNFRQRQDRETVIADLPFPSVEIDPSLADYLGLSSRQIRAVQHLVSEERRELDPMMAHMRSTHEKLLAASACQSKEAEVLAATEAGILTKLLIKSADLQARRRKLLTREQQMKLEGLNLSRQP